MTGIPYERWIHPERCAIWFEHPAKTTDDWQQPSVYNVRESDRTWTDYSIDWDAIGYLRRELKSKDFRPQLTTLLIDRSLAGESRPHVTKETVEAAKSASPLVAHERADRLLRFMAQDIEKINDRVVLREQSNLLKALAWSESTDEGELYYLIDYLENKGWLSLTQLGEVRALTVEGHAHIAELSRRSDSAQAFVAMWLHKSMDNVYEQGIEPAIRQAGYTAYRIDRQRFTDTIDNEILKQVSNSRFLIADFTHGRADVRGSVYYEAGLARGLGITVLLTARVGTVPHFDTAHFPHIFWETPAQLKSELLDSILAIPELGQGPKVRLNTPSTEPPYSV